MFRSKDVVVFIYLDFVLLQRPGRRPGHYVAVHIEHAIMTRAPCGNAGLAAAALHKTNYFCMLSGHCFKQKGALISEKDEIG